MNKELTDFIIDKTNELLQAPNCCNEARTAAERWLLSKHGRQETEIYFSALKEVIMTAEELIVFAESDAGIKVFGTDFAKKVIEHAENIKKQGKQYCDCRACNAVLDILEKEKDM